MIENIGGWRGLLVGLAALMGACLLSIPVLGMLVMASDGCRSPHEKPICDVGNQHLLILLPLWAALAGALLVVVGGGISLRRRRSTVPWLVVAWLPLLAAWVVSFAIASAGQSAP